MFVSKPPPTKPSGLPVLLTPRELAAYLKVSVRTIHRYTQNGLLPSVQIGDCTRFNPVEVVDALQRQRLESKKKTE